MSGRYQLTATAQQALDEIGAFIAEDNVDARSRYTTPSRAFERLAEHLGIGHTRQDLTERPLKFWSVFSYLVVYDPLSRPLSIVAVLHGARDGERERVAAGSLHHLKDSLRQQRIEAIAAPF